MKKAVERMGGHFRRRRIIPRMVGGRGVSWTGYLRLRGNSILFLGLFIAGLFLGSLYTVRDSGGPGMILSLVANDIGRRAGESYFQLLAGRLGSSLGFIVFLYFAANCVQGRWLACLVPVSFGLSVGAAVTAILFQYGLGAAGYLLLCLLPPRFLQLVLLMTACNQAVKLSREISPRAPVGERSFLLLSVAAVLLAMLETLLIGRFTGLLGSL